MKSKNNLSRRDFTSLSLMGMAGIATTASASSSNLATSTSLPTAQSATRKLGDLTVSAIGLGCMSMKSGSYNPPRPDEDMIPVIRGAYDSGVTFFDTAEVYGPFTDETLVGKAVKPFRDKIVIGSKFGFAFGGQRGARNSKPENIKKAVEGMLKRLQTDRIDLLYCHRIDPEVPVEDVAGTVQELIKEGKALHFGLSEVSPETIRKAHMVQPVAAVQSEYSMMERAMENGVLQACEELGIGFVPWGAVVRGFLGDKFNEYCRFSEDSRFSSVPYFKPEAIDKNMAFLRFVRRWADRKNATPAQIALAWVMAQKPFIVPIPGSTKLHHIKQNQQAINIQFTKEELAEMQTEMEKIEIVGFRSPDSVLTDK